MWGPRARAWGEADKLGVPSLCSGKFRPSPDVTFPLAQMSGLGGLRVSSRLHLELQGTEHGRGDWAVKGKGGDWQEDLAGQRVTEAPAVASAALSRVVQTSVLPRIPPHLPPREP